METDDKLGTYCSLTRRFRRYISGLLLYLAVSKRLNKVRISLQRRSRLTHSLDGITLQNMIDASNPRKLLCARRLESDSYRVSAGYK
jgi:hypothetical protein